MLDMERLITKEVLGCGEGDWHRVIWAYHVEKRCSDVAIHGALMHGVDVNTALGAKCLQHLIY